MSTRKTLLAAGPVALTLGLVAQSAHAQTQTDEIVLDTITVEGDQDQSETSVEGYAAEAAGSATRGLPADIATTPRSVSVITSQQLTDQGATSLEEAIAYTPGVTTQTFGFDNRYDQFAIRGFVTQNTGSYRDGMPLRLFGWGAWRTETFGLERVEVLRGPTSSLYGANEPGGLVNSITKRPKFEQSTELMARTSAYGGVEVGVDTTGPISDTLAYRFVFLGGESGTEFDKIDERRVYIAPSVTWSPSDATNLTLFAQYQKDKVGDTYNLVPQYGSQLPNPLGQYGIDFYTGNINRKDIETTQNYIGYEFDHEFGDGFTFRSRARYADNDWTNETAYAASFFSSALLVGRPAVSGAIDAANLFNFNVDQNTKQTSFDNGLMKEFSFGNVDATVIGGVDYYHAKYKNTYSFGYGGTHMLRTGRIFNLPGISTTPVVNNATQDIKQTGLYLLGNFEIGDRVVVDASLRHDWLDSDSVLNGRSLDTKQDYTSGNIGASYSFDSGVTVYGSASRSFNLPPSGADARGQALDVESAKAFEVGAKFRPLGSNSLVSVALFDITKSNTPQAIAGVPGAFEQIGEVRSKGVELEVNYNFANGLSVLGAYNYINAKITEDATNKRNRVARIPEHSASLWLAYDVAQAPGLRLGLGARYTGNRFSDSANTAAYKLDDVTVLDAAISYEFNGWLTTLSARNLADKRYVTYCQAGDSRGQVPGSITSQTGGCAYGAGRTVELSLSRRF